MDRENFPQELERIRPAKKAFSSRYRHHSNISGIGVGVKKGEKGEEIAIVVTLKKDLPMHLLPPEDRIPDSFMGFPVIVKVTGEFIQHQDFNRYRPAPGGCAISPYNMPASYGTLGCWVDGSQIGETIGKMYLITNYHVLPRGTARVLQPGSYQPHNANYDIVSTPGNTVAVWWKGVRNNQADVAVAKPAGCSNPEGPTEQILDIGIPTFFRAAFVGQQVRKRGARTLLTNGEVILIDYDADIEGQLFDDQILVERRPPSAVWGLRGDSGSIVIETEGNTNWVVGLHHADTEDGIWGVASHWGQVVNALNQTVPHMVDI